FGDVVVAKDALRVAAQVRGEGLELRLVAHDVLELALDFVREPRDVRLALDALAGLGERRGREDQGEEEQGEALQHGNLRKAGANGISGGAFQPQLVTFGCVGPSGSWM